MASLLAFLGVATVLIVTPGQDTALTIRNTLTRGRKGGVRTALGVATGQTVWASAVFFTSLLPQFGHSFAALFALGLVIAGMTGAWLVAYAVAVSRAGDFLRRSRIRRTLDALTGTALVAFGLRLGAERS